MSAMEQIKLHSQAIYIQFKASRLERISFHMKGIFRALFHWLLIKKHIA